MSRLERLVGRRPVVFCFVAVVVVFVVMGATSALAASLLGDPLVALGPQIAGQIAGALVVLSLLWRMESLAPAGVTTLDSRRWWLITTVIVTYTGACALWSFFGALDVDLSVDRGMAPVLVHTALAGVMEELLFRGLVLYLLVTAWGRTRRGVVASVLVSAVLFGVSHLLNLASGASAVTILQATEASLSAVLYGALVLSSGSVWPAVALHSLVNVVVNIAAENVVGFDVRVGDYVTFTLLQVPVFLYAVFLLAGLPCHAKPGISPARTRLDDARPAVLPLAYHRAQPMLRCRVGVLRRCRASRGHVGVGPTLPEWLPGTGSGLVPTVSDERGGSEHDDDQQGGDAVHPVDVGRAAQHHTMSGTAMAGLRQCPPPARVQ